ncbi:MAG: MarR family transcriptional regulator [Pseudomonadota bacterium]
MPQNQATALFQLFNEIGIIEQLSRTILESHMPDGLIAPHFSVLNHLIRVGDGSTPVAMARAFQVPKTSMTHTLSVLERRGLVDIKANPDDRRSKQVWLTDSGRVLRNDVIESLAPALGRAASDLGTEKLLSILPILTEMRIYLDTHRDGTG